MESNAAQQLAAIADTRAAVADRLVTPFWYHPLLGLLVAGYIVGMSVGDTAVKLASGVLFSAGAAALAVAYRQRTGIWVSGLGAGRAGRWAIALGALIGVAAATAWATATYTDLRWPVWTLAVAGLVGTVVIGRRFDTALRAQLRAAA
ncbi:hypothetical protein [Couchioplanes azureus]|uniref:hypothetical protein n=1 Tax=Couchioplanes caeruleus TaxID=56438 RepID=UPI0016707C2C|nr:hypothetical protein [Couchioplanes caeruleus]GGQ81056.1 hypothetical protein GCM10010166_58950 [Couchioplanes caeruleus subsp. azureus]